MYHIKEDKRTKKSAELLCSALNTCLQTKNFSDITIVDLQNESSVARATFYRLFDNTVDVLEYQCDQLFKTFLEGEAPQTAVSHSTKERCLRFFDFLLKNKEALINTIKSGHIEIIYNCNRRYAEAMVCYFFGSQPISENDLELITLLTSSMMTGIGMYQMKDTEEKTSEDVYETFQKISAMIDSLIQ